jgi:hypothetical protein
MYVQMAGWLVFAPGPYADQTKLKSPASMGAIILRNGIANETP